MGRSYRAEKVEGKLTRVDCLNGPLRLTILNARGAAVKVAIRDLNKLTVNGANEAKFAMRRREPAAEDPIDL